MLPDGIGLVAWIGGLLLAVVLLFAIVGNRRRTKADEQRTNEATRDLYARVDREDQASDPDPKNF